MQKLPFNKKRRFIVNQEYATVRDSRYAFGDGQRLTVDKPNKDRYVTLAITVVAIAILYILKGQL